MEVKNTNMEFEDNKKNYVLVITSVLALIVLIVITFIFLKTLGSSPAKVKIGTKRTNFILNYQYAGKSGSIVNQNGHTFINSELFTKISGKDIKFDKGSVTVPVSSSFSNKYSKYFDKDKIYPKFKYLYVNKTRYLDVNLACDLYGFYFKKIGDNYLMLSKGIDNKVCVNTKDIVVYHDKKLTKKLSILPKHSTFYFNGNYKGNAIRVIDKNFNLGYINSKSLSNQIVSDLPVKDLFADKKKVKLNKYGKLKMAYDYLSSYTHSVEKVKLYDKKDANLDVIIPTGFTITQNGFVNKMNIEYVKNIKKLGYSVVAGVDNNFDRTVLRSFLSDEDRVDEFTDLLEFYVLYYDLDGICIAFENASDVSSKDYLRFLKLLSQKIERTGATIMINACATPDRKKIDDFYSLSTASLFADYVIVSAYDEYTRAYGKGPVASLEFTENLITDALQKVNAKKLILGIPAYTRLYIENDKSEIIDTQTVALNKVKPLLKKNYDYITAKDEDRSMQYVYYTNKKGHKCQFWLEDKGILNSRIKLVNNFNLKGVVVWSYGLWPDWYMRKLNEYLY